MHRVVRTGTLLLAVLLIGASVAGAQAAVGVLDIRVVWEQSIAGQEANQLLQAFIAERQQVVDEREAELDGLQERINDAEDEEGQAALQAEFDEKLAVFQQLVQQFQAEIDAHFEDLRGQVLRDIEFVMDVFGPENGYDVILDAASVLYNADAVDVTEAFIAKYDEMLLSSREGDGL